MDTETTTVTGTVTVNRKTVEAIRDRWGNVYRAKDGVAVTNRAVPWRSAQSFVATEEPKAAVR